MFHHVCKLPVWTSLSCDAYRGLERVTNAAASSNSMQTGAVGPGVAEFLIPFQTSSTLLEKSGMQRPKLTRVTRC